MTETVVAQLRFAREAYRQGRFAEAEAAYRRIREIDPGNATALAGLGTIALWNNNVDQATNFLREAVSRARGLRRHWPLNAQLNALLGMACYREDNFREAARLFREAAGPAAAGPFRDMAALGHHLALFGDEPPYVIEGPSVSWVGFVATDPIPAVEVSLAGRGPFHFIIDTGAAEVILDAGLAREMGAEISGTMTGESAGPKGRIGLGRVESITLGDVVARNVPIHTMDTRPFSGILAALDIKGVIGTRLLMHFHATIDYPGGALVLRRRSLDELQESPPEIGVAGVKEIPFWLIQTHYMVAWGTVNGKGPWLFLVDTGLAGRGFTAPAPTLKVAGIRVDWGEAEEGVGGFGKTKGVDFTVDELALGPLSNRVVENSVPGVALEKTLGVLGGRLGFWIGGLISHQFFRNYALTLDFEAMRLLVEDRR